MVHINTIIPNSSRYFIYLDVPYRFAARHCKIAFLSNTSATVSLSLSGRIRHLAQAILLCLPIIGHIIAIFERFADLSNKKRLNLNLATTSNQPSLLPLAIPPSHLNRQPQEIISKDIKNKPLEKDVLGQIQEVISKLEERKNPYFLANRKEIIPASSEYIKYEIRDPFYEAWHNRDLKKVKEFLINPYFKGINKTYAKQIKYNECVEHLSLPHFLGVIELQDEALFNLFIENKHLNIDYNIKGSRYTTALNLACSMGKKGEPFIKALIAKRVNPLLKSFIQDKQHKGPFEFAKESGVGTECLKQIEDYLELNKVDSNGNTCLQQAILAKDMEQFEQALQKKVCLNVRNFINKHTALHQAIKLFNDPLTNKMGRKMVLRLIEEEVNVNLEDCHGQTPFLCLCAGKAQDWEEIAIALIEYGANFEIPARNGVSPIQMLLNCPENHVVKKRLIESTCGQFNEYQNCANLATLFGIVALAKVENKDVCLTGGNFQAPIFEVLSDIFQAFLTKEVDPKLTDKFKELTASIELAKFLATTHDLNLAWQRVKDALATQEIPIIIPSGWEGHATSVVIFRNLLILCNRGEGYNFNSGLHVYHFRPDKLTKSFFEKILSNSACSQALNKGNYIKEITSNLLLTKVKTINFKDQKHSNCTWISSALLGLHTALAAIQSESVLVNSFEITKEINAAIKKFNHFAKYWMISKYLSDVDKNLENMPCQPSGKLLSSIVEKICQKIKEGKDLYGYYRQALDAITFSGIKLTSLYPTMDIGGLMTFYASLYGQSRYQFIEALNPEEYVIGKWILS